MTSSFASDSNWSCWWSPFDYFRKKLIYPSQMLKCQWCFHGMKMISFVIFSVSVMSVWFLFSVLFSFNLCERITYHHHQSDLTPITMVTHLIFFLKSCLSLFVVLWCSSCMINYVENKAGNWSANIILKKW